MHSFSRWIISSMELMADMEVWKWKWSSEWPKRNMLMPGCYAFQCYSLIVKCEWRMMNWRLVWNSSEFASSKWYRSIRAFKSVFALIANRLLRWQRKFLLNNQWLKSSPTRSQDLIFPTVQPTTTGQFIIMSCFLFGGHRFGVCWSELKRSYW